MQIFDDSIALVVCTRNRSEYMAGLLDNLKGLETSPGQILIVDSSCDDSTLDLLSSNSTCWLERITYLKSSPGLPHQRNVGINTILKSQKFDQVKIISFTDDDCRLSVKYFEHLSDWANINSNFSAVTGTLVPSTYRNSNIFRKIFYLDGNKPGAVLKSGCTTPLGGHYGSQEVEWIPGGSMNIKRSALESIQFDGKIRMYGEDLKMSLMLRKLGPLFINIDMEYNHLEALSGKDNLIEVISFTDGIRWELSRDFPDQIQRRFVLWSITGSLVFSALRWFSATRKSDQSRSILLGHLIFLRRLVLNKTIVQEIK